jgi:hypothetical protein
MKKTTLLTLFISLICLSAFAQTAPNQEPPTVSELNASASEVISALQAEHNSLLSRLSVLAAENAKMKAKLDPTNKPSEKK